MNALIVVVPALLLAGCLATRPTQWAASGEDPSLNRALYECKGDTDNMLRSSAAFGGIFVPIAGLIKAPGMFDECMAARGFAKTP